MHRIVLVTGASRGIGRAVAKLLAEQGWLVVATARATAALDQLHDEIGAAGGEALTVPLDLKDADGVNRLGAFLRSRWGRLDGFVANAGILGPRTPLHAASDEAMSEVFDVNYRANHRLVRVLHPLLMASDAGRAVFVSSGAVHRPRANMTPYAASKAALESLALCYAEEVAAASLRVNVLEPGPTRTAMRALARPGEDPLTLKTPEDVAPYIAALLDPACTKNGEIIVVPRPPRLPPIGT